VITGYTPANEGEKMYIGSSSAWIFRDPAARAVYLEFSGQGLGALERLKAEKEKQMAVLGARMLEQQKTAVEKPEAMAQHRKGEESMLAAVADTISQGLTKSLEWFAAWAGDKTEDVVFQINKDFYPAPMTSNMLTALVSSWQQGAFSDQVLFDKLQQGEIISREVTFEEEQARIEAQEPKLLGQDIDPRTGEPTQQPPQLPPGKKQPPNAPPPA